MITIEVWADDFENGEHGSTLICTPDNIKAKNLLHDDAKLLHSCEAVDWNDGKKKAYELLGYGPYIPVED